MARIEEAKLDHMLLFVFRDPEQPEELLKFFKSANAFEFGVGVWLVPIAAAPSVALQNVLHHLPSAGEGVVVMSVARYAPQASIHNYPALVEWFQSVRELGQ